MQGELAPGPEHRASHKHSGPQPAGDSSENGGMGGGKQVGGRSRHAVALSPGLTVTSALRSPAAGGMRGAVPAKAGASGAATAIIMLLLPQLHAG